MKTIKINVPLTVHYELLPPPVDGEAVQKRIESRWCAVTVAISGSREAVDYMLSVCPTNDPPTLIQRALSALGYVVGDHEKDVAQFSRWVDHLVEFPRSEEALELWTKSVLALLPSNKSIEGASLDARDVVVRRMRLFPPAPKTGLDDGPPLPEPWAELQEWRSAAKSCGIASAKELAGTVSETFGQFVDRKVTRDWQEATGCNTPEVARLRIGQLNRFLDDWQIKSGVASPDALVEKFRITEDAWKEATCAADTHAAYKKIANLELQLVSYASEIDALRKAHSFAGHMRRDPAEEMRACDAEHEKRIVAERELAKVRAELQSKCREAQTAKERADENAREMVKRGALLDKIAEALGRDFNHDSLPEHVADLKRAYDNVNDCLVGPDNLVNETKEIASILVSQIKDAGIESAAGAIAGRSVHLSVSWAKTMQAREILLASPGESIVDAAKRTMDRCANLEGQIVADDNRTDELRKILHAKEGESVVDAAKRAIIPLPKPEKIKPGQRWAFVMKATSGPEDGNAYLAGRFRNAWGNHYGALTYDIRTGFYLGT